MKIIHRVLFSSALLLALDFIYLSANKGAWETQIVQIQRVVMQLKIVPAILCYLLLIVALNYFILRTHRPVWEAFMLGVIIYGVFDTTNYALFKKWDWKLGLMDGLWGGVLFALTTSVIYSF
jgi:uncharacterized membrane protein